MKITKKLGILLSIIPFAASAQTSMLTNPLLVHSNAPIEFNKVNAQVIKDAVSTVIKVTDARVKTLVAIPAAKKTVANTLMGFDGLSYDLSDLGAKLSVIASTYADDATRNAANDQSQVLGSYGSDLYLNEGLYKALKAFSLSATAKTLSPTQHKFLKETIIAFEINGMKLDQKGRDNLKVINDKLISFGNQFDRHIAESKDSIEFSLTDLQGIPEAYITPWKRANGHYMVRVNGPNYINILKFGDIEATRKAMYLKYQNRAYPANMATMDSLFSYRQKLADQLGYKTYAEYALVTKMAGKPVTVWSFLDDLKDKLTPHVGPELDQLKELKKEQQPNDPAVIYAWDIGYYSNKLLDTKYKLNTELVRQYFEMNNTIQGMFTVYQKLFNIQIHEIKGLPVWDPKIKSYELDMDGKKMGTFFLDLYPRPNKYTHFETAPISTYHIANGKEVLPVGTLICNFPEGTTTEPSLLDHSDVITMFHEFGHLIHFLLCHPVINSQLAFSVKGDFVEAPSQFLENFCWNYDVLKLFAKNYKTGEVLPKSLFDKMKAAQNAGVSIQYIRQVSLAMIDFTFEDRFNAIKAGGIDQVEKDLWTMNQTPYPEGSHFICSFGHLNGYGANYYGYLWSKVYAQDIFSVFEQHGVLDQATGVRYRKEILQEGAQEDEMAMLRHFLGREPNSKAFLKSLGIK
ncbi:M3 family metallopeptidase [Mucilaginibacter sp. X5P1]|uniref:M3 family metallopeptidase n=1 Tax=Mucilaginibacter sp. X5P1 TaxID=2723088 RepID=UPI00161F2884|nr:M3 family metallopeptidase [Mucilaginibacter sp. X5P1]MBB6138339.1 Zn-dependent oligopeptidase [Mucilaginibacter sp. X5P1]